MNHFIVFLSPLFLFSYVGLIGYATLSLLNTRRTTLQNMLFAPAVGLSVLIITVFTLSWYGIPVKNFASSVAIFLLLISTAILFYKKPLFPIRRYFVYIGLLIIALMITGRFFLSLGLSWFSYLNDDMLNYCLSATYFLNHGYFGPPDISHVVQGKDYSQIYWFMNVTGFWRAGSELLLAWVSAVTHLKPLQVFMPIIVSLHLMIIHAIAGMNYTTRKNWQLPVLSAMLYAMAAMANLGIFYQLIAQADGLVLFVACVTFLMRKSLPNYPKMLLRYGILCAILTTAFAIFYPELCSLFVLSLILYFGVLIVQYIWQKKLKSQQTSRFFLLALIVIIASFILLHSYVFNFFTIIFAQIDHAGQAIDIKTALFPYFLIPSGLADLWGFQAIADLPLEPWLSLTVFLSVILLMMTTVFSVRKLWGDHNACAAAFLSILFLAICFFIKNGDFILFKLSMYFQPFLWSICIALMLKYLKNNTCFYVVFFGFCIINLCSNQIYINRGRGVHESDLPYSFNMNVKTIDATSLFLSDTSSIVLAKMEMLALQNHTLLFPSNNFFESFIHASTYYLDERVKSNHDYRYEYLTVVQPEILSICNRFLLKIDAMYKSACFSLFDSKSCNSFRQLNPILQTTANTLLESSIEQSILNRWHKKSFTNHQPIISKPLNKIHNHLIFIDSALGEHYYLPLDQNNISLYMLEKDYFYPEKTFSALKRYFLFEVLNPVAKSRFVWNITTTLNGDHKNSLPHALVIGKERQQLSLLGHGSARVFSQILVPQMINGQSFIMLDTQQDGQYFEGAPRSGLMKLYGKIVLIDRRQLMGFGRDISFISDEQYQNINAPNILKQFPQDLDNPDLEYSGFYEDGWIGDDAYLYLSSKAANTILKITGSILSLSPILTVWIDGKEIKTQQLVPGDFVFNIPVILNTSKRHCVKLHFSAMQNLPDTRPASAQIKIIGFESIKSS